MKISERASLIAPSATLSFDSKAKQLKAEGRDIVLLTAGQPDFLPPKRLVEATKLATENGEYAKYAPVIGTQLVRARIAQYLKKYGMQYEAANIAVSSGGKLSLANLMLTLIDPDDEVLIPSVFWVSYPDQVRLAHGVPVFVPVDKHFRMSAQEIERRITKKTVLLIVNSPANPTGTVYTRDEMLAIASVANKHNLTVISDEIYSELVYDSPHVSIATMEGMAQRTLVVSGASKCFAIPGWRLGYFAGPREIVEAFDRVQGADASNPNAPTMVGVAQALDPAHREEIEEYFALNRLDYKKRRDYFITELEKITYRGKRVFHAFRPDGAFYLWVNIAALKGETWGKNSDEIANNFLTQLGVAATKGSAFGNDDYLRFSFAVTQQTIQKAIERLKVGIEEGRSVTF